MISSVIFISILSSKDANETLEISLYCLSVFAIVNATTLVLNNIFKEKYTLIADSILIVIAIAHLSFV